MSERCVCWVVENPEAHYRVRDLTDQPDEVFAAELARIEGAPELPEAYETTERVMRAIWESADGYMAGVPWERARLNAFKEAKVHRQACAAIDAMRAAL